MTGKSRWGDDQEDAAARKREKEEKKQAKLDKQRRLDDEAELRKREEEVRAAKAGTAEAEARPASNESERPSKRRKLSTEGLSDGSAHVPRKLLRFTAPEWSPCRHIDNFERLNHIEEGSYGWVSRARETATGEIVALKKLKMDNLNDGFPVTALREIQTLKESRHRHIVDLREVVMGDTLSDVFLVMDFLEHDLKTLQEDMSEPFLPSEVKTLMLQITSAVDYLHDNWILHRDLKTSNILMNNRGEIKLADFGMARYFGDPAPANMTQLVVTLWYRAPELLLGAEKYDQAVDMWSVGCIFGELLKKEPLLQGKNEVAYPSFPHSYCNQTNMHEIFELCGIPTDESWPSFRRLPNARGLRLPRTPQATGSVVRSKFPLLTATGSDLLNTLLSLNPDRRPSASEVLGHSYFREDPRPKATAMFPTFPSKAGQEKRRRVASPVAFLLGERARKLAVGLL